MAKNNQTVSGNIKQFCDFTDQAKLDYQWNYDEVNRLDKLTQDYLHSLELDNLNYKERAKVATQLQKCRQERRIAKDIVENLAPLVDFLSSDKGNSYMKLMREVQGRTRKTEAKMKHRFYVPRVLEKEDQ